MPSTYPGLPDRPLRRDAKANRERILEAARGAFAELGIEPASRKSPAGPASGSARSIDASPPRTPSSTSSSRSTSTTWPPPRSKRSPQPTPGRRCSNTSPRRRTSGNRPWPLRHRRRTPPHRTARRPRALPPAAPRPAPDHPSTGDRQAAAGHRLRRHLRPSLDDRTRRRRNTRDRTRVLATTPGARSRRATRTQRDSATATATHRLEAPASDAPLHPAAKPPRETSVDDQTLSPLEERNRQGARGQTTAYRSPTGHAVHGG